MIEAMYETVKDSSKPNVGMVQQVRERMREMYEITKRPKLNLAPPSLSTVPSP